MTQYKREVEANFDGFSVDWKRDLNSAISTLDANRDDFLRSYGRLVSLSAWRAYVFEARVSEASLGFFSEAVNDALTAHVFARCGNWRSSLMSLRSCIENSCYFLFYKDHLVELRLWELGRHKPGFTEVLSYLESHPDILPLGGSTVTGLAALRSEYATLSRAVHASAKGFRMSPNNQQTALWRPEALSLAQWRTRESRTLAALNLLLLSMFSPLLHGSQHLGLRRALALAIPASIIVKVKTELKVTIVS